MKAPIKGPIQSPDCQSTMNTQIPPPLAPRPHPRGCRPLAALAALTLTVLLAGCGGPASRQPIGAQPTPLRESHLPGTWIDGDGKPWQVRVADERTGHLEIASIDIQDGHGFEMERTQLFLRDQDGVTLYNLQQGKTDVGSDTLYFFGRFLATDRALVLFPASSEALRELALAGTIGAEIQTNRDNGQDRYEVLVTNRYDRLATELAAPAGWRLLDTRNPLVLTRP